MKTKILVGAVAAVLYGGVALAGDNKDCPAGKTQASLDTQVTGDQSLTAMENEPVDSSIGGSGMAGTESSLDSNAVDGDRGFHADVNSQQAWGGSGTAGTSAQSSDMVLRCQPVQSGTGGSGTDSWSSGQGDIGGSGIQSEPLREPQIAPPASAPSDAFTPIDDAETVDVNKESKADMRGLTVMLGGGVEGYTGALAHDINAGATYGVTAAIKPSKVFGLELGYSGAVNDLDGAGLGVDNGPDLVRNGGQAALTFGLGAAPVQPYVLGGIGFSDYNFRGESAGFSDDMVGNVPVGAGLRTHIGDFTVDLRGNYNFLFDQDFAGVDDGLNENGRYSGTLNIGGTF
ncbi:MAG TPA: hypothetical protein VK539_14240 [Myxococcaceae bacterium]|nr:hypothetical protein [Myxococcaceae bacterium]